jgi:hypothetical protein
MSVEVFTHWPKYVDLNVHIFRDTFQTLILKVCNQFDRGVVSRCNLVVG